jgi:S-adenosylmethionine uptake transporter
MSVHSSRLHFRRFVASFVVVAIVLQLRLLGSLTSTFAVTPRPQVKAVSNSFHRLPSHNFPSAATGPQPRQLLTPRKAEDAPAVSARQTYITGISWYLAHFVVGIGNDGIMKYLGESSIPAFQIVFLRFLMAAVVLLPIMLVKGKEAFQSARFWMHGVRGLLLALGIGLWCRGLAMMPFASCVVINNTMPFFKMIFATIFLGEKVGKERWLASIGGFIGCLIVFNPTAATFQPSSLVLILSACCFAMLDIFNKKYAVSESVVSMLFYGSVSTALIASVRAIPSWVPVTASQFVFFALLGVGANLLLFCLLRSFRYVDASATCPYRYTEFVLSAVVGFLLFRERPMPSTLLGSAIILPSVIYCAMVETRKS